MASPNKINFCCGCLSSDRKITNIDEFWKRQCFLQILSELPMANPGDTSVLLCWECEAVISRFAKFKMQAKQSYRMLQDYAEQNIHLLQRPSKLCTEKVVNISILPLTNDIGEILCKVVKLETPESSFKDVIKEEIDTLDHVSNYSDHFSDDDDKLLIEISSKSKEKHQIINDHDKPDEGKTEITTTKRKKNKIINGHKKKRKKPEINGEVAMCEEIELTKEEVEEERRLLALREEFVNAMFKCDRCILSFPNADDLKDHVNAKHVLNASNFKCKICECSFSTEVSYNYHTNRHTRRYQCAVCMELYSSKRGATKHFEMVHCHSIDMDFGNSKSDENMQHKEAQDSDPNSTKDETPSFPCESCDKMFRWKTSLRKHLETHRIERGQKRKPYCEPCRLSFTTTSNLQKHVKTSSKHQIQLKLRKLKESLPEDSTSPEKQLAHYEQIKSSVNSMRQQFPCGQCDKRFQWRGNLLRHLHSHTARANGELVCKPCNRTFSSIATFKQHMKISKKHVSENDFKYMCSDCGKRFANKTPLRDHMNWDHHKNYIHKCSLCQKVFKTHTSLYLHEQVVHKKYNAEHLCDHCGKSFPNRAKLRSHITALHTTQSPYKCGVCAARFSWHSCLSRHVRRVHRHKGAQRQKGKGE